MADKCTYFRRGHVSESLFPKLNVVKEHNEVRALVQTFLRLGQFTNLSIDGDEREGGGYDSSFKTRGSIIRNCA